MSLLHPGHRATQDVAAELGEGGELSDRVLGLIGSYGMNGALDANDLYVKQLRSQVAAEPVVPSQQGYVKDGVYHVAE